MIILTPPKSEKHFKVSLTFHDIQTWKWNWFSFFQIGPSLCSLSGPWRGQMEPSWWRRWSWFSSLCSFIDLCFLEAIERIEWQILWGSAWDLFLVKFEFSVLEVPGVGNIELIEFSLCGRCGTWLKWLKWLKGMNNEMAQMTHASVVSVDFSTDL